jgi:DNA (cytosine-5)-methyltransferase 1
MATINYYLDKQDKKGFAPIHLRINSRGKQIKIATCLKVMPQDFNKDNQAILETDSNFENKNTKLNLLKAQTEDYFNNPYVRKYTLPEIKNKLRELVNSYHSDEGVQIVEEDQLSIYGQKYTFLDFFAGAGGFSEGFLQAEYGNRFFDFILASDINDNCELTHLVRYNHQLGLDTKFLKKDISEPDFIDKLKQELGNKTIDVICGGPPCQSFSLAGKRKKFDKKDDLFSHYLEVIKLLKPKYFIMENVKGILTKENGKIQELIINKIRSIIDIKELPNLYKFIYKIKSHDEGLGFVYDSVISRIKYEEATETEIISLKEAYISNIENRFKKLTPKIVDYKTSKTDFDISTIRHGLNLLIKDRELSNIQRKIIKIKDIAYLDNDLFVDSFNQFLDELESESIIEKIEISINRIKLAEQYKSEIFEILEALKIYNYTIDDCIAYLEKKAAQFSLLDEFKKLIEQLRLYKIEKPFIANASNYGVPQNRERVLFIGCRKDQKLISEIEPTVSESEKVAIFEALYDLDFIDNDEKKSDYIDIDLNARYNGFGEKYAKLIRPREIDGKINSKNGKTYSEWSKQGRLNGRFKKAEAFYVKNFTDLKSNKKTYGILHNHQTSNQKEDVIKRLDIILKHGDYVTAKKELSNCGLDSQKRNYNVLKADGISPTVMTIPDDYVHFSSPRALTVREMARLQSFDDSFVFQGKRSTGGEKRREEIPQFTLVGNAVPPLLARAVAMKILKNIK